LYIVHALTYTYIIYYILYKDIHIREAEKLVFSGTTSIVIHRFLNYDKAFWDFGGEILYDDFQRFSAIM